MKCPFCNVEMIHGYLNCGLTLWSTKKHRISLLPDKREQFALRLGKRPPPLALPLFHLPFLKIQAIASSPYDTKGIEFKQHSAPLGLFMEDIPWVNSVRSAARKLRWATL